MNTGEAADAVLAASVAEEVSLLLLTFDLCLVHPFLRLCRRRR